jgi:hypothetical protein
MVTWKNAVDYGPWTYEAVDALYGSLLSYKTASDGTGGPGTTRVAGAQACDIWIVVTYSDLPATPTSVTPANGATVTVPNPTVGGTMAAIATGQSQKMEWQFATNTGFTANVQTVTEVSGDLRASGATTETSTFADLLLTNGTWYMRGRAVDEYGIYGPYSSTNTITVNTPVLATPTAVTPAAAATVTTMTPTYGGTLGVDGAGRLQKMEWQTATDNAFTLNAKSLIEADSDFRASGATTEILPSSKKITFLEGTTWYLRGRSVGNDGTTSAWSATTSYTLSMAAPPTPTSITPATGSTITTSVPTLGAVIQAASESRLSRAQWQFATDSGFTANIKTVTEAVGDQRISGSTLEVVPLASKLFQSLWYMRCRAVDQYGQLGSYSASQTFTVVHLPVASPSAPISDAKVLYATNTTFSWSFSDPYSSDVQTAYQVIVERNDTNAVVFDTGKVSTATHSGTIASASLLKDVKLRWKVRVWDVDNVAGLYSPYQLFTLSDLPVVTITSPTNAQQIGTGQPTITWTNDAPTVQASRRVVIRRVSDNVIVHDSGTAASTALSYTTPVTVLANSVNYTVTVTVTDTNGMVGSSAARAFSTLYVTPAFVVFSVDPALYEDSGYINVSWATQIPDSFFIDWRVYRRLAGVLPWTLQTVITDPSVVTYHDWTAGANLSYEYAVTQTAGRSGLVLESYIDWTPNTYLASGTHYWLINPFDETDNLKIDQVTADSFTDDYEEAEFIIIGRGRKKNLGTRHGYTGTLTAQFRDNSSGTAREKRLKLEIIKAASVSYYLRNPFGDLFEVSLGNLGFARIAGVSTSEFVDVTIPYSEVF